MKKITAAILLISMLLVQNINISVSATAYYDDITAKAELLSELGIISYVENEADFDKEVTRRDFIIASAKLLGINIYEVNPNRYYKDMTDDDLAWNAAGALLERNILTMNESRTLRPNDVIVRDEAVCIITKMLGIIGADYETTLAIARRYDLYCGVTNNEIILSDMVTLLHNALTDNAYSYLGTSNNNFKVERSDETLMEIYFDLYHIEGVVTSVNDTSIASTNGNGEDTICINGTVINTDIRDPYFYLGCYVSAYYTKKDGRCELKYISIATGTNIITIDAEDFAGFDSEGYAMKYYVGDKIKSISVNKGVNIINNGDNASKNVSEAFENIINGEIICIDADNDKIYETVAVNTYENMVVRYVDTANKIIYGTDDKLIDLSDSDKSTIITNAAGEEKNISDISKNDTISLYASEKLNRLVVSGKTVTGELTRSIKKNNKILVKINENEYVVDESFAESNLNSIKVGATVTAYIDAYNKIAELIVKGKSGGMYAYVIDYSVEKLLDESVLLKLFTENDEITVLTLDENVKIDGNKCTTANAIKTAMSAATGKIENQIVIIDLNKDNEIASIDTAAVGSSENGLFVSSPESEYYFYSGQMLLGPLVQINSSTKLFVVPQSEKYKNDPDAYMVAKGNSFFKDWEKYKIEAYRTGDKSKVGYTDAMLLKTDIQGTDGFANSLTNSFIISDISEVYDDTTETIREQITLRSGKSESTYLNADNYSFKADSCAKIGNVVKAKTNSKGDVTTLELLYGEKNDGTKVTASNNTVTLTGWGTKDTYAVGYVESINDGLIGISMEIGENPFLIMPSDKPVAVYEPAVRDSVYVGGENDLIDAMNHGYKIVVDISRGSVRSYSVIKVNY